MKRLAVVAALIVVAVLGVLLWQRMDVDSRTFRLKATATILVDGVERTGSAVQEYRLDWNWQPQVGNNGAWRLVVRGEAIRIDVPSEEPIYALISADVAYDNCANRTGSQDQIKDSLLGLTRCEVKQLFPTTIRFDGSGNYQEAIAVHVGGEDRNGYRFARMTFERTDDPITEGRSPPDPWPDLDGPIKVRAGGGIYSISKQEFKQEYFR